MPITLGGYNGSSFDQWQTILTNGNVGIGTANPGYKLDVSGRVGIQPVALPAGSVWSGYTSVLQAGGLFCMDYSPLPQTVIGQNLYYNGTNTVHALNGYASCINLGDGNGNMSFSVFSNGSAGTTVSGTGNALFIKNNGNIGIGTANPNYKLDVNGDINIASGNGYYLTGTGTNRNVKLFSTSTIDNFSVASFYPSAGTNVGTSLSVIPRGSGYSSSIRSQIGILNTDLTADPTNYEALVVRAGGTEYNLSSVKNGTGAARPIFLDATGGQSASTANLFLTTSGSAGIGTTNPAYKLDISGNVGVSNGIVMTGTPTSMSDVNYIRAANSSSTIGVLVGTGVFNASDGPYFGARGNTYSAIVGQRGQMFIAAGAVTSPTGNEGTITFFTTPGTGTAESLRMLIGRNGNVGIGTLNISDANYKLFVETGIKTRKVKVDQSTWSDYVFGDNYRLPSLKEVEEYIQQNKHLLDIPSAKEVKENGLDLGDNQALLLKKIEELTLYVIEINKKVEKLSEENEVLKRKINNK